MDNTQLPQVTTPLPTREGLGGGSRWGIIYCPKPGVRRTHQRWEHIKELLDQQGTAYDFLQSEGPESVERLTKMLIQNGYTTLIIVGGDSALNRALNGLLSFGDDVRERTQLGLIPNGRGNDFAGYWGITEDDDEQTVRWLQQKRIRKIDVGYIRYTAAEDQGADNLQYHYFLNCVNIGLVAKIMKLKYKTRRIFGLNALSYFSSMILLLFQRLDTRIDFHVNEEQIARKIMTVCIGNSRGYGQTPRAVPYNGMLDVSVVSHPKITELLAGMWMLLTGKFISHRNVRAYRTSRSIAFADIGNANVSTDGLAITTPPTPFEIGLLPEHINFIIPS